MFQETVKSGKTYLEVSVMGALKKNRIDTARDAYKGWRGIYKAYKALGVRVRMLALL